MHNPCLLGVKSTSIDMTMLMFCGMIGRRVKMVGQKCNTYSGNNIWVCWKWNGSREWRGEKNVRVSFDCSVVGGMTRLPIPE